ncbi:MAG: RNA-guided pseudouridylation complex pseudouridine synthase subunit Cbf5 [Candidatus Aenigmatarchaeota archaeon]
MMKSGFIVRTADVPSGTSPSSKAISEILKNGFLVLDKPAGPTSQDTVATVKKMLGLKKAGQSGTLDPETSGVLLITTENACKVMPLLNGLDKEYVCVMHAHRDVDDKKLVSTLKEFVGTIKQKPPVKSAVKRVERFRNVYKIEILDRVDKDVCLQIACAAGTYIRKLVHDIGEKIGGAHMKELRRVRVGPFTESESHTLQELKDSFVFWRENGDENIREIVLPIEYCLRAAKIVVIKDSAIKNVRNGSALYAGGVSRVQSNIINNDVVALVSLNGALIALGNVQMDASEMIKSKGAAVKVDRVL